MSSSSETIPRGDWLVAGFCTVAIHLAMLAIAVRAGPRSPSPDADVPEETSIDVTPVIEDLPSLKLGSARPSPRALPDMAPRPVQIARSIHAKASVAANTTATNEPSKTELPELPTPAAAPQHTTAEPTPEGASSATSVASAQPTPPPSTSPTTVASAGSDEAAPIARADPTVPTSSKPPPVMATKGAADGTPDGTETDPLKAQQVSLYRAQIDAWFSARFPIRGRVAWETLKTLRAVVNVSVQDGRRVGVATIVAPSGNAIFDDTLRAAMARVAGSILPAPPPRYPDILGTTLTLNFRCSVRSQCE